MCTRVCMFQLPNTTQGNVSNVSKCRRAAKKNGRGAMMTLQRWRVMTQEKMEGKSQTERASEEWDGFNKLKYVKAKHFPKEHSSHFCVCSKEKSTRDVSVPGVWVRADAVPSMCFYVQMWTKMCFILLVSLSDLWYERCFLFVSTCMCGCKVLFRIVLSLCCPQQAVRPHQREASFMQSAAASLSLICALTYIVFDSLVLTGPCVKNVWLSQEDQPPPTLVLFACSSETSALVALFPETPQVQSPATEKD